MQYLYHAKIAVNLFGNLFIHGAILPHNRGWVPPGDWSSGHISKEIHLLNLKQNNMSQCKPSPQLEGSYTIRSGSNSATLWIDAMNTFLNCEVTLNSIDMLSCYS